MERNFTVKHRLCFQIGLGIMRGIWELDVIFPEYLSLSHGLKGSFETKSMWSIVHEGLETMLTICGRFCTVWGP